MFVYFIAHLPLSKPVVDIVN